jgi:hypothetical protein
MSKMQDLQQRLHARSYDCGIDPRGKTPAQIRAEHNEIRCPKWADQFDARLDEVLREAGA